MTFTLYIYNELRIEPIAEAVKKRNGITINMSDLINIAAYVWFFTVLLLICTGAVKYFHFRSRLRKKIIPVHVFSRPKITIAESKYVLSPFLIGIISPVVIIPRRGLEGAELRLALKHELTHYRRRDILFKTFAEFLKAVNFYDPAFYLLQKNFADICELTADETVTENFTEEKRRLYCKLLLDIAENKNKYNKEFCLDLSRAGRLLSERMNFIMDNKKRKNAKKLTAVIACAGAASVLSIAGFAAYKAMPDMTKVVYAAAIPQKPVSGFSLLSETGSKLPENFISPCDDFFPFDRMYSVSGKANDEGYSIEKLAYDNGQVIVMTDDKGSGFELSEGQKVSLTIVPDYSPSYNNFGDRGELVSIGYILDGVITELETPTGRVPGDGLELSFTAREAGNYYFYAINCCAGLQNYKKVEVEII